MKRLRNSKVMPHDPNHRIYKAEFVVGAAPLRKLGSATKSEQSRNEQIEHQNIKGKILLEALK